MRGVIINPYKQTVSTVYDDFENSSIVCHLVSTTQTIPVRLDPRNVLHLDACGPGRFGQKWWYIDGYPQIMAGKGLILGGDENGDFASSNALIELLEPLVKWATPEEVSQRYSGPAPHLPRLLVDRIGNVTPMGPRPV